MKFFKTAFNLKGLDFDNEAQVEDIVSSYSQENLAYVTSLLGEVQFNVSPQTKKDSAKILAAFLADTRNRS